MADNIWLPAKQQSQLSQLQQKQALSKALLGTIQAPQAQMVGGRYIAPGIAGGLLPLVQAIVGSKMGQRQAAEEGELLAGFGNTGALGNPKDLAKSGKYDPQSLAQYGTTGNPEDAKLKRPDIAKKYTGNTRMNPTGGETQVEVEYPDGSIGWETQRKGMQINNNLGGKSKFDERVATHLADQLQEGFTTASKAKRAFNVIENSRNIIDQADAIIVGPLAKQEQWLRGVASRFLGTDASSVASTQELFSNLVKNLDGLAKEIGGAQISNIDLQTAMQAGGADMGLNIKAIQSILNDIEADAANKVQGYQQLVQQAKGAPMSEFGPGWIDSYTVPDLRIPEGIPQDELGTYRPRHLQGTKTPKEIADEAGKPKSKSVSERWKEMQLNKRVE